MTPTDVDILNDRLTVIATAINENTRKVALSLDLIAFRLDEIVQALKRREAAE